MNYKTLLLKLFVVGAIAVPNAVHASYYKPEALAMAFVADGMQKEADFIIALGSATLGLLALMNDCNSLGAVCFTITGASIIKSIYDRYCEDRKKAMKQSSE